MKVSVVGVISIWLLVQLVPAALALLSLDLGDATKESYSAFLTALRNEAKDRRLVYQGVPMLPPPPTPAKFLLVELKASPEVSMTLALNKSNIYIIAYLDKFRGKYRAHFFGDAPENAKASLFKEANLRLDIHYDSGYLPIEARAGTRRSVGLGLRKLKLFMEQVYGNEMKEATEAKFLLVAVQMVSEAARFKYIEDQVLANFLRGFTPNYKIPSIENKWRTISTELFNTKDGKIDVTISDPNGKVLKVTKVSEIVPDMRLLCYRQGASKKIPEWGQDDN